MSIRQRKSVPAAVDRRKISGNEKEAGYDENGQLVTKEGMSSKDSRVVHILSIL
jgi:hypothetical protein